MASCSYGAQQKSPIGTERFQRLQSKVFRNASKALLYSISDKSFSSDINISTVTEFVELHDYNRFNSQFTRRPNPLITQFSSATIPGNPQKRRRD